MILQSLKKRRTIRPNIHQTAAAADLSIAKASSKRLQADAVDDRSQGALRCVSLAALMLTGFASTVHAASQDAAIQDDGAISLKSVLPARTLVSAKVAPAIVPAVPSANASKPAGLKTAAWKAVAKSKSVRPRGVLLTSGQDEAATIQIPELLPPPVPGLADSHVSSVHTGQSTFSPYGQASTACQCQKCRTKRGHVRVAGRRGLGQKIKAGTKRVLGCFVEVEECDEVHFDVDDYHMPILLVSASDETTEKSEDDSDSPAAGLLSRKLTDIQPTLAYAYGEQDDRVLPEAFYKKVDHGVYEQQVGPKMVLQWEPTNLWYYPLYFQDTGLERYGHTHKPWVQPFVSTGKFFGQVATLPYRMTLDPPTCPEYSLGYYQPGEWAPKKKYQLPFNEEAAATQFLWMTGFFLLIP